MEPFLLSSDNGFQADLDRLEDTLREYYDLVVLVNPNNPTGRYIPRQELEEFLSRVSPETKFWIDEAYLDYVGADQSLERFAAMSENVVVCKSMSKVYALSGLRVGYLSGPPTFIDPLRRLNPPWAVGLPGQLAAITALHDPDYYRQRYEDTHIFRRKLASNLRSLGDLSIVPGSANFLLFEMPDYAPSSETVIERCRERNLFLRDPSATTPRLGHHSLRIAVKDDATNLQMVEILS